MTDAEILVWLRKDQRKRVVLVELDYRYQLGVSVSAVPTTGTLYFSNFAYIDESASPIQRYQAAVVQAPEYERSLDRSTLRGRYNTSVGSLVLNNADGEFDYILDLALDGSEVRVYVGDETWVRDDFVHLYTALALKASASKKSIVTIDLRDPALLLNKRIGGMVTVGDYGSPAIDGPNANQFRPINFGWVHQADALLQDPINSVYVHSDTGDGTTAIAVRNDGVDVTFTDNADGTFSLAVPAAGNEKITCDVLGIATGSPGGTAIGYRLSDAVTELIGNRGGLIDRGAFSGPRFDWIIGRTNDYPMGISIPESRNVVDILDDLMDTLNGFWAFDRTGMFYYYGMRPEALAAVISESLGAIPVAAEIAEDDVRGDSFSIEHAAPRYSSYQCYSNINWTSQATFGASLSEDERARFTRIGYPSSHFVGEDEGSTAYRGDTASWLGGAPELYHLTLSDSEVVKTLISGASDTAIPDVASGEDIDDYTSTFLSLRRSIYLPWLEFIDVTVGMDFYALELGDIVNMTFPRHGLNNGRYMQVAKVRIKPTKATVDLSLVRRRFADVDVAPGTPGGGEDAAGEDDAVGSPTSELSEYVPTITYVMLGSDQTTSSTSFVTLLTGTITVAGTGDIVNIFFTASGTIDSGGGNTPQFQITVDGSDVAQTCVTCPVAGGRWSSTRVVQVTGLSAGAHAVLLKWSSANGNQIRVKPITDVGDHATLVCRLAPNSTYVARGSNSTSTATTVTDALISTTHSSLQATSALYVRFSAMGINNSARTAKFRLSVDGTPVCGCADTGDGAGLGFNAGMVVVVPVTAGSHTVAVTWAGGAASGSTIDVSDPRQHACMVIEEVNTGSPRFTALSTDASGVANTTVASASITTPAGGFSDILIEATCSVDHTAGDTVSAKVNLDGSNVSQSRTGSTLTTAASGAFMTYVGTSLSAAAHTEALVAVSGGNINAASNPEYMHANIIVWPVDIQ